MGVEYLFYGHTKFKKQFLDRRKTGLVWIEEVYEFRLFDRSSADRRPLTGLLRIKGLLDVFYGNRSQYFFKLKALNRSFMERTHLKGLL